MRFCFLFLLLISTLFSIDSSTPDEVANLSAQPSSIVGGYVNVITGDFVYRRSDLTIPGAVPLTIDRFFSSREKSEQDQKWEIFCHHRATKSGNQLYIQEASGIAIPYIKVEKGLYRPDESFFTKGVSIHSLTTPS